jgi:hypothetical protein
MCDSNKTSAPQIIPELDSSHVRSHLNLECGQYESYSNFDFSINCDMNESSESRIRFLSAISSISNDFCFKLNSGIKTIDYDPDRKLHEAPAAPPKRFYKHRWSSLIRRMSEKAQ